MRIPDLISPIVAYRVWQWDSLGLKSLNNEQWFPGCALEAKCKACVALAHEAPRDKCSCGVYAAKDFDHLQKIGYAEYGVHGEVYLWGTVVEHSFGYRAQFAYPKYLVLPPNTIPVRMSEAESRMDTLMAYGADIFVTQAAASLPNNIPLWSKQSGLDMVGFNWLMERGKRWYSYREPDPTLKAGDRVAVLGKGVGVVGSVDTSDVHVVMWNKVTLRISCTQVAWNRQNWRWEANGPASFARSLSPRRAVFTCWAGNHRDLD